MTTKTTNVDANTSHVSFNTEINLNEFAALIAGIGHLNSIMGQGEPGIGKSAVLQILKPILPNHRMIYVDMTTKDVGDFFIPHVKDGISYMAPTEALAMACERPCVLMFDEFGKATRSVQNTVLPCINERRANNRNFHPETRVCATTNLTTDGVGDAIQPHAMNRLCVTYIRKPTNKEWYQWGVDNALSPEVLTFAREFPKLFATYRDPAQKDNPYIYHPTKPATAFVTPRSLHKASNIVIHKSLYSHNAMIAALAGTLGESGARDLAAFIQMGDQLESMEVVESDPLKARVPDNAAALCLMVSNMLVTFNRKNIDAYMDYILRIPKEAQALFATSVVESTRANEAMVPKFTKWAIDNQYMFK